MAKLKAPLFSFAASGKLADALVFFNWKGLNVVRSHVTPSNPKTALQQTQRGYMGTIVDAIHTAQARATFPLVEVDQTAYSALATTLGKVMTWFNMACKLGLDGLRLSDGWTLYCTGAMVNPSKDDFRPSAYITDNGVLQIGDGKFYLGTSPTNLVLSEVATIVAGSHVLLDPAAGFSGLIAATKYYWQFRPDAGDPCEGADSGIYYAYAT